ncbi:MAG: MMPL family transporter [Rhodospirillaceae bacterium]
MTVKQIVVRLVDACQGCPRLTVLLCLLILGPLATISIPRLGMDTDLDHLLSARAKWRQQELAFENAFPQFGGRIAAVVEGANADVVDDATALLAARMAERTDLFTSVSRPDADPFFRREGLLFLAPEQLSVIAARVIEAQPFIGSLARDPSLRGLFGTLGLALTGVARGDVPILPLERPLAAVADAIGSVLQGADRPLGWSDLLTRREPRPGELRRFVLFRPVGVLGDLTAAAHAIATIRETARTIGLTEQNGLRLRITGVTAIEIDEMATLAGGAGLTLGLSMGLVSLVLFIAVGSIRLILPILLTLVAGLLATASFAAFAVGALNPISIAFAVLFVGLAVDFSIQIAVRYREERFLNPDPAAALRATANTMAGSVSLAALTTSFGFLAFLPTAYVGVSQLGLIAGVGMLIALALNFTLLPALLVLFRPKGEQVSVGFACAAPLDRALLLWRPTVLALATILAMIGLVLSPWLRFDSNPMNLRDARTESVSVALDLMANPDTSPFTAEILVPDPARVPVLLAQLKALPEVHRALALAVFVPEEQERKLAVLDDLNLLLGPTLSPTSLAPQPDSAAVRRALATCLNKLRELPQEPAARRLGGLLEQALGRDNDVLTRLSTSLLSGLAPRLNALREALTAVPVTLDSIPESLRRDWIGTGGQARIQVFPSGNVGEPAELKRFVRAVRSVAPEATGPAVTTFESAQTIVDAFTEAGLIAFTTIFLLLLIVLRRLTQVLLVLVPLALSALMTLIVSVAIGLPLNFANIIALPLLLGIGVAFNIYFVINWRHGQHDPLQSSTARAVLFSALTTTVAFGTLALSDHPGTASMGLLLTISLGFTLLNTMITLPALLGPPPCSPLTDLGHQL